MEHRMNGSGGAKRGAFSLLELLLVVAILGVVMALAASAVQRARDAAAKTQCANNLRQLGLAAQQYHDSESMLPSGMRYQNFADPYPLMSWMTELLPYVDQQSLWTTTLVAYRKSSDPSKN